MLIKRATRNAREDIQEIAQYICKDSPSAAMRFAENAQNTFLDHPPNFKPRQVFSDLPEVIRVLNIQGFDGYVAYYAEMPDGLYLLAVAAPGLSDARRLRMVQTGLTDMEEGDYA